MERLESRNLLAVSFEFNYLPGDLVGFNDPIDGPTYRQALESAGNRLGSWLLHDAVIEMDISSFPFDGTAIGTAGSVGGLRPPNGGFVHHLIPNKILNGQDNNGEESDGHIDIYFFGPEDTFSYQPDPDLGIADDQIDFQAVIIHELMHALGFTSATNANGTDDSGDGISTPGAWSVFDQFVSDVNGNRFIDADPNSPTAYQMNVASWAIHSVGGKGPDAGLFFDGPVAKSVYGNRVPLYSPATFLSQSSVSHLDSEGYPDESFIFSPITHLTSHVLVDRPVPQELTLLEKAILTDIGYQVREDIPPVIIAETQLILEANSPTGYVGPTNLLDDFIDSVVVTDQLDPNPEFSFTLPTDLSMGDHTIVLNATDLSGNSTTLEPILSVVDRTPPTLTVTPENVTVEAIGPTGFPFANLTFLSEVSDIVDPNPSVTHNAPDQLAVGQHTVTFYATDTSNNQATQAVSIEVVDTTPPVFTPPSAIQIASNQDAGANLSNLGSLTTLLSYASDLVDLNVTLSASPEFAPLGMNEITFTATDDSGNQTSAEVAVHVIGQVDLGDAPDDYPVSLSKNGARHEPSSLHLGSQIDFDLDGIISQDASGDGDDDDGVEVIATNIVGASDNLASWAVEANDDGRIDAWIDFNLDGDWLDDDEQIATNLEVAQGVNLISYSVPKDASIGPTYARIRLSSMGNLATSGPAPDGEVEDYQISLIGGSSETSATVQWITPSAELSLRDENFSIRQEGTTTFSSSSQDIQLALINGSPLNQQVLVDWNPSEDAANPSLVLDGGSGNNEIIWSGSQASIDLSHDTELQISNFQFHDLRDSLHQLISLDQATVNRLAPSTRTVTFLLGAGDLLDIADKNAWRITPPKLLNDQWFLPAQTSNESNLELLISPTTFWNNFLLQSDINNDGVITAGDALKVINELSARRFSDPVTQESIAVTEVDPWPDLYFDQNRDHHITALDALRVINDLARNQLTESEGEQHSPKSNRVLSILSNGQHSPALSTRETSSMPWKFNPTQTKLVLGVTSRFNHHSNLGPISLTPPSLALGSRLAISHDRAFPDPLQRSEDTPFTTDHLLALIEDWHSFAKQSS